MLARATGLFGLWLVLTGAESGDLLIGAVTAAAATWTSVRLIPRGTVRATPAALPAIAVRLLGQSIVAGVDVARRALDPRLPIRPGFVSHPLRTPPGLIRDAFCALASLLPGTVPSGSDEDGVLLVHCLDVGQPVLAQLAEDEARLARALGGCVDG